MKIVELEDNIGTTPEKKWMNEVKNMTPKLKTYSINSKMFAEEFISQHIEEMAKLMEKTLEEYGSTDIHIVVESVQMAKPYPSAKKMISAYLWEAAELGSPPTWWESLPSQLDLDTHRGNAIFVDDNNHEYDLACANAALLRNERIRTFRWTQHGYMLQENNCIAGE